MHLVLDSWAQQTVQFAWGRVFTTYGPGTEVVANRALDDRSSLNQQQATCRTPHQVNDFIHVQGRRAEAFVLTARRKAQGCFNISAGPVTRFWKLAKL
ncbi:MAG: hypothetical protein R3B91_20030 [Planctomycetaceae bacterium]